MKLFLKLFVIACLSTIVFGVFTGVCIAVENFYEISFFSNFVEGFTFGSVLSFPIYLTLGILFSYLIIRIKKNVNPAKPYFFGLLMYSLAGFIVTAVFIFIFRYRIFGFFDTVLFLGIGVFAFNIYYHFFVLINIKLEKRQRV